MSQLQAPKSKSQRRKEHVSARRREDWAGTPDDRERLLAKDGGKIGRRLEGAPVGAVKEMRRAQARARIEGSARQPMRRTPRGTVIEGWMGKVNDRIEKRRGAGR